ncbi:MAG: YheV family putative zinc ribbon protein [Vibrio sp.]
MKIKKRFIAGATCPMCEQKDSLRVWIENEIEVVECVECDYVEQRTPVEPKKPVQPQTSTAFKQENVIGIFKPE